MTAERHDAIEPLDAHSPFAELAAGHALDALEPEDEDVFLAHAFGCARCQRDVTAHRVTASRLAYAVEPAQLPAGLLEAVRREVGAGAGADELAVRRARRRPVPRWAGAAAAAVVAVGLLGWNVGLQREVQQAERSSRELTEVVTALSETLSAGPVRTVPLRSEDDRVAAVALLQQHTVSLVVEGLAPNDTADSTYVLWQVGEDGAVSAVDAFDVGPGDRDVVRDLALRGTSDRLAALAVTREPGRTAPAVPGSEPLADAHISA